DSVVVIPIDELASPPEETEPIIPPPSTDTAITGARITIRPHTSISLPPEAEVERLLAMPTPSPSPLTSLSPPSTGERLARCTAPAALPLPLLPPSLYPPPVDRESSTRGQGVDYGFANIVEAEMRHRADMSSASSAVTYTSVYTDSEPGRVFWGADEELSDEGPEEPQTPPAPQDEDEHELMFIQPHDPDFVPEPIYPEYIPLEDEHILLAEEQ
nr:hypothetical protein [Tanacetum cinerariifolium]